MKKEEIYKLVEIFGLTVDFDQWDTDGHHWIRVISTDWPQDFGYKNNCLILYKDDGYDVILNELRQSLIHLGENIRGNAIYKLLVK